jgi:hypothetical protein
VIITDAPFHGATELLRTDPEVDFGYRSVLDVLVRLSVPRRRTPKSQPRFVFDQTELQRLVRSELGESGWSHGHALSPDIEYEGERMAGIRADMIGSGCHVILEFGNRASFANNLVTRGVGSIALGKARLLVFVAPRARFADQIDANLATYERIAGMLTWLERKAPGLLPAPICVVGVAPYAAAG